MGFDDLWAASAMPSSRLSHPQQHAVLQCLEVRSSFPGFLLLLSLSKNIAAFADNTFKVLFDMDSFSGFIGLSLRAKKTLLVIGWAGIRAGRPTSPDCAAILRFAAFNSIIKVIWNYFTFIFFIFSCKATHQNTELNKEYKINKYIKKEPQICSFHKPNSTHGISWWQSE